LTDRIASVVKEGGRLYLTHREEHRGCCLSDKLRQDRPRCPATTRISAPSLNDRPCPMPEPAAGLVIRPAVQLLAG
jgi:hypothetical protein